MIFPSTWHEVLGFFKENKTDKLKILPHQIQHPKDAGMSVALDVPVGQRTTYRMMLAANLDLVVRDFVTYYEAFLELRPTTSGIEKALTDTPGTSVAGMVAAGALLGLLFGRSKNAALTGAAVGGLAGLAGVSVANAKTAPQTSKVAFDLLKTLQAIPIPVDEPKPKDDEDPPPPPPPPGKQAPRKKEPQVVKDEGRPREPRPRKKEPEVVKIEVLPREPRPRKKEPGSAKMKALPRRSQARKQEAEQVKVEVLPHEPRPRKKTSKPASDDE